MLRSTVRALLMCALSSSLPLSWMQTAGLPRKGAR